MDYTEIGAMHQPTFTRAVRAPRVPVQPSTCSPAINAGGVKPWQYVIQPGDYPASIAQKLTGDPMQWVRLRNANRDDPAGFAVDRWGVCNWRSWYPGKRLKIPADWPEATSANLAAGSIVGTGWGPRLKQSPIPSGTIRLPNGIKGFTVANPWLEKPSFLNGVSWLQYWTIRVDAWMQHLSQQATGYNNTGFEVICNKAYLCRHGVPTPGMYAEPGLPNATSAYWTRLDRFLRSYSSPTTFAQDQLQIVTGSGAIVVLPGVWYYNPGDAVTARAAALMFSSSSFCSPTYAASANIANQGLTIGTSAAFGTDQMGQLRESSQANLDRFADMMSSSAVDADTTGNEDKTGDEANGDAKAPMHPAWYVAITAGTLLAGYGIYRAVT